MTGWRFARRVHKVLTRVSTPPPTVHPALRVPRHGGGGLAGQTRVLVSAQPGKTGRTVLSRKLKMAVQLIKSHTVERQNSCLVKPGVCRLCCIYSVLCPALCLPGQVSETGLVPCLPCPRGYFQPDPGKSSCFLCPRNTLTPQPGSYNIEDCQGMEEDIMMLYSAVNTTEVIINECFKEPCGNGGSCESLNVGYICSCLPGWTGTLLHKIRKYTHS